MCCLLEHRKGTQASGEELENLPEDIGEPARPHLNVPSSPSTGTAPYCARGTTGSSPPSHRTRTEGGFGPQRQEVDNQLVYS